MAVVFPTLTFPIPTATLSSCRTARFAITHRNVDVKKGIKAEISDLKASRGGIRSISPR
jgi:hypothetical protein